MLIRFAGEIANSGDPLEMNACALEFAVDEIRQVELAEAIWHKIMGADVPLHLVHDEGFEHDVQKRVPWITWASAGLRSRTGLSMDCLREHRDQAISHDNYFHAVLGWMQVKTSAYQAALDPYVSCRQPASEGASE